MSEEVKEDGSDYGDEGLDDSKEYNIFYKQPEIVTTRRA